MSKTIAIALSGGVDSSYAAHLLNKEGNKLIGVSHDIWPGSGICSPEVMARAEAVCKNMGIKYFKLDMQSSFKKDVVDDYITAYLHGKTPNPCVRCNEKIRFNAFYYQLIDFFRTINLLGKEENLYFSTGHYVRKIENGNGLFLKKARDISKDQSYMLYRIKKELLEYFIFPLGELHKKDIVENAKKLDLPSASVRESQDACFIHGNYADFIKKHVNLADLDKPGEIIDMQGNIQGKHRGYINYTIGQRKGLGLGSGPWYVNKIDPEKNLVYVGREDELRQNYLEVNELNWFIENDFDELDCFVKVRYNSKDISCTVKHIDDQTVKVNLENPSAISPGQSAVFYKDDIVLGGGIIRKS